MRAGREQPGAFELEETSEGVDLVVTGTWSQPAAQTFRDSRADGLVLNYARGFRETGLELVAGLPISRLTVLARTIEDLTPVYSLASTLTDLSVVSSGRAALDLARLPRLRKLSASWPQVAASLPSARTVERLFLLEYDERDFAPLAQLDSLMSLRLKDYPGLVSLDGVEEFPWLAELGVFAARRLEDISALSRLASPILKQLELASCRTVPDLSAVADCPSLEYLNAANCGDFPSASPLAELHQLESLYLYESTRFVDGDLSAIAGLPRLRDLRMMPRSHYRPSVASIKAEIAARP